MSDSIVYRRDVAEALYQALRTQLQGTFTDSMSLAMNMANEIPEAEPERKTGKWIPCSERLPEDDVEVFIYLFERSAPYIAWVEDCRWYTEDFEVKKENYPTAWMPLPEPYQEGQL